MRIVIDLQGAQCGSRHRGIGRYSLALARAMIEVGHEHEFLIALSGLFPDSIEPIRAAFDGLIPQDSIRVWNAVGPVKSQDVSNNWRRFSAEYLREAFIANLRPDIVHVSSLMEGFDDDAVHTIGLLPVTYGTAVTFYDAIPLIQSEVYLKPHPIFEPVYREKIAYLKRADMVLAISESSRQEAIAHLGFEPKSVVDIAAAADACFTKLNIPEETERDLRRRLRLDWPFIMYSGATDDRKNHLRLIQAFARLPRLLRSKYQLAIVGRLPRPHQDKFEACILACGLTLNEVVITGGVSDDEMTQLYNLCHLFVFPSWHEGFGLPALEAMACGAPVIGSDATSVPEVIGRKDALFDPLDVDSIAEKIQEVLLNEEFRQELIEHAPVQARNFSWDRSARGALTHMENWYQKRVAAKLDSRNTEFDRAGLVKGLVEAVSTLPRHPIGGNAELLDLAALIVQNVPAVRQRRLFVDVSELMQRDSRSGIQRVVRSVLEDLLTHQPEAHEVVPVGALPTGPGYVCARNFVRRFQGLPNLDLPEELIDEAQPGDVFLGLDLQPYLVVPQREYLKRLRDRGVRIFFVLYDLLPILKPNTFPAEWDQARIHTDWLDVLAHSDGVVCISRAVADEFLQWLDSFGPARLRKLQVGWFHLGGDLSNSVPSKGFPANAQVIRKSMKERPNFLSVATLEPRKGHAEILDAADLNWANRADFNVVFVGKRGWDVKALTDRILSHSEFNKRLFWLDSASDEYLDEIYRQADCLVAASQAEGFGLPLLEAAHHGLSVIARDISVFREVATGPATFFDESPTHSLCVRMQDWLKLARVRSEDRVKVPAKTWRQATSDLLDVVLRDTWYGSWTPEPGVLRLWAASPRLGTAIGVGMNLEVFVRPDKVGCALYGPYLQLAPGRYAVVLRGRVLGASLKGASMDVALDKGDRILAKSSLTRPSSLMTAELACVNIVVPENCVNLEVRVWVDEPVDLALTLVQIRRLN